MKKERKINVVVERLPGYQERYIAACCNVLKKRDRRMISIRKESEEKE